jgi:hypothetical protein
MQRQVDELFQVDDGFVCLDDLGHLRLNLAHPAHYVLFLLAVQVRLFLGGPDNRVNFIVIIYVALGSLQFWILLILQKVQIVLGYDFVHILILIQNSIKLIKLEDQSIIQHVLNACLFRQVIHDHSDCRLMVRIDERFFIEIVMRSVLLREFEV